MTISIPEKPKIKDIPIAVEQLIDIKFNFKKLLNKNLLEKINHDQFLFLIGIAAYEGKNFNDNMNFLKTYINKIDKSNIDLLLKIELILHKIFIKKYETEDTYNIFYNFFSKLYPVNNFSKKFSEHSVKINKILFYVHAPTFLAHTIPLFHILTSKKEQDVDVGIAAYGFKEEFKNKCDKLGLKFYDISDENYVASYKKLKEIGNNYDRIVWQSVPIHLSYFRSIYNEVCYWSLKFHPNIPNIMHYIGVFSNDKDQIIYNNNLWKNLNIGFKIENLSTKVIDWKIRKLNFGAFCREELINETKYWEAVNLILANNENSIFYYCGRKPIHQNWIKKLNIDEARVIYLGWLKEPHLKLKEMAFLLDGYKLGHGYLAIEAMAAEVPIIYPKSRLSYGNVEDFLIKTSKEFNIKNLKEYKEQFLLDFKDKNELIKITNKLFQDKKFNKFYGEHYKKIASKIKGDSFEHFCSLLN